MDRAGKLIWFVASVLVVMAVASCVSDQSGERVSPVVPVATLTADDLGTQLVVDIRSNGNVTLVRTSIYGRIALRDVWTGATVLPPRVFAPGKTYVWRREPRFDEEYALDRPLPAWVADAQGLWNPGEAEALGYTFEAPPDDAQPDE